MLHRKKKKRKPLNLVIKLDLARTIYVPISSAINKIEVDELFIFVQYHKNINRKMNIRKNKTFFIQKYSALFISFQFVYLLMYIFHLFTYFYCFL